MWDGKHSCDMTQERWGQRIGRPLTTNSSFKFSMKHKNKVKCHDVLGWKSTGYKLQVLFSPHTVVLWLFWTQTMCEFCCCWHIWSQSEQNSIPGFTWVMNHWPFMCETERSEDTKVQTEPLIWIYPSAPCYSSQMWACIEVMTVSKWE